MDAFWAPTGGAFSFACGAGYSADPDLCLATVNGVVRGSHAAAQAVHRAAGAALVQVGAAGAPMGVWPSWR